MGLRERTGQGSASSYATTPSRVALTAVRLPVASIATSHGTDAKYGGTVSVTLTVIVVWLDSPYGVRAVTLSAYEPTSEAFGASVIRAVVVPLPV